MATISHSVIVNYFKNLQENLNGLNSFFRMDLSEIKGAFRSSATFPALVLESHESQFSDSNLMQSVNARTFAFTVYCKPANQDYNDQNTKLDLSEELGLKIIARMRYDARQPNHFLNNTFKVETVRNHKVGPVFNEKLYGYRFTGEIVTHEPQIVSQEDWKDIDKVC